VAAVWDQALDLDEHAISQMWIAGRKRDDDCFWIFS